MPVTWTRLTTFPADPLPRGYAPYSVYPSGRESTRTEYVPSPVDQTHHFAEKRPFRSALPVAFCSAAGVASLHLS